MAPRRHAGALLAAAAATAVVLTLVRGRSGILKAASAPPITAIYAQRAGIAQAMLGDAGPLNLPALR
jgi:hypothetical protein